MAQYVHMYGHCSSNLFFAYSFFSFFLSCFCPITSIITFVSTCLYLSLPLLFYCQLMSRLMLCIKSGRSQVRRSCTPIIISQYGDFFKMVDDLNLNTCKLMNSKIWNWLVAGMNIDITWCESTEDYY